MYLFLGTPPEATSDLQQPVSQQQIFFTEADDRTLVALLQCDVRRYEQLAEAPSYSSSFQAPAASLSQILFWILEEEKGVGETREGLGLTHRAFFCLGKIPELHLIN